MATTISATWKRIAAWLQLHAPEVLEQLQPPATDEQLEAVAAHVGVALPDPFKVFYQIMIM